MANLRQDNKISATSLRKETFSQETLQAFRLLAQRGVPIEEGQQVELDQIAGVVDQLVSGAAIAFTSPRNYVSNDTLLVLGATAVRLSGEFCGTLYVLESDQPLIIERRSNSVEVFRFRGQKEEGIGFSFTEGQQGRSEASLDSNSVLTLSSDGGDIMIDLKPEASFVIFPAYLDQR